MELYQAAHKAWAKYRTDRRNLDWWREAWNSETPGFDFRMRGQNKLHDPGMRFCRVVLKLSGVKSLHFDWQSNGDCIVQGVIYLTLKSD